MKIIIINGSAKNGKTNFANFFEKNYKYKCVIWSTIDKVKGVSKRNFGWNGKKTDEARKFLAELKRIWIEFNNGPFNEMINKISTHYSNLNSKDKKNFVYLIDCREPSEIQKFVDKYGKDCITILLKRNDREIPDNYADKNVDYFNYHYIIDNNRSKKELEKEAIKFIENIMFKNNF
jgi:hypothetical protein